MAGGKISPSSLYAILVESEMRVVRYRFIYQLHQYSTLPWVYGGEYDQFCQLVKTVVQAWIDVRLKLYFVFDGRFVHSFV
jgi:hypothetical protein